MKKTGFLILAVCLCLLSACSSPRKMSGKIIEAEINKENGTASFVIHTDTDKEIGILLTDETLLYSFTEDVTADELKSGAVSDVIVTVEYEDARGSLITQSNQEITAYNAKEIQITGFLTPETAALSDGTNVEIWQDFSDTIYTLQNGTELLEIGNPSGPDNVTVGGIESLDDLKEEAQLKILEYYQNQGLLYDTQAELEKAYAAYLEKGKNPQFDSHRILQDISPSASSDTVMYCLTSVQFPIDGNHFDEYRMGAAFDKQTGKTISTWELFSCSPDEAIQKILDIAGVRNPTLKKEMETAFKPENIIFFPDSLQVYFQQGTLPSQKDSYLLSLDYDKKLSKILNGWAIPNSSKL